jgi:hypothetical protein
MKFSLSIIALFFICSIHSTTIQHGIYYKHIVLQKPLLSIHAVCIDISHARIIIEPSQNKINGSETVTDIAKRTNAIVALNGGFFDFCISNPFLYYVAQIINLELCRNWYPLYPVFCLKIKNKWLSLSHKDAGIIGWKEDMSTVCADITKTVWSLDIAEKKFPIKALNKPHVSDAALYTYSFGKFTPKRRKKHIEIIIDNGCVKNILYGRGKTIIPEHGFVYALEANSQIIKTIKIGQTVIIKQEYSNMMCDWNNMDYLLASTPLLIKDGKIIDAVLHGRADFFTHFHPRSAVGVREDGKWILVVVEGRNKESRGVTLLELAQCMYAFGCKNALNLDGGGSSAMVIKQKLINNPSGSSFGIVREERAVANALLVMPRI